MVSDKWKGEQRTKRPESLKGRKSEAGSLSHLTFSNFSSPVGLPFPMNKCLFFVLHPSIFRNSSNSSTRLLQHVHPLVPS